MRKAQPLLTLITLLVTCSSVAEETVRFGASLHESQWGATGSRMQCTLLHEIPHYGKALFTQNAGEGITFSLRSKAQLPKVDEVQLVSVAPSWKHDREDETLWNIPITQNRKRINLNGEYSLRVFNELTQGMAPTFKYLDPADGQIKVLTTLSPVWLRPALTEFTSCIKELLPYNFKQIRHSRYYFDFDSSDLRPDTIEHAEDLVEFITVTENIRRIKVDGHTDDAGHYRYNRHLGRERAEVFKAYLVENGIPEDMIDLKSFGERRPESTNKTAEGRAINRRILVTLER